MKKQRSLFVIMIALSAVLPLLAQAQVDTVWVGRWTSPGSESDWAYAIAVDDSGQAYVTGKTENAATAGDWTTIKYKPEGDTAWVRDYASPGSYNERASSIVIAPSGNIYITGYTMSTAAGDYLTIKYRPDGDTAWTRRYNGVGGGYDFANWVTVDADENVYVTGYSRAGSYQNDIATVKYDSSGNQLWYALYNGSGNYNDEGYKVITDGAGYVYVVGHANPNSSGTRYDYVTIKYDPTDGDTVWARTYNGTADSLDQARDIAVDAAGNVYVTGSSRSTGTMSDIVTIKYDSLGELKWLAQYNNPDTTLSDGGYGIEVDVAGNVYVVGQSQGVGTGADIVTIKYDSLGSEQWAMRYDGPASNYDTPSDEDGGKCVTMDASGNIYIAGTSSYATSATSRNDFVTIMYGPDGTEHWATHYNCCDSVDAGLAVAIDTAGGVYICGRSIGLGTYYDMAAVKYQSYVGIAENEPVAGGRILLEAAPNPFTQMATVRYTLPRAGHVTVSVHDALGRTVKTLVSDHQLPGTYAVRWDGTDDRQQTVTSGVYFYVLEAPGRSSHEKIVKVE